MSNTKDAFFTDHQLALELVDRLNTLCEDPATRMLLGQLIETRVNVSEDYQDHPTVQVISVHDGLRAHYQVGFLGMLNGIIGVIPEGTKQGFGYVTGVFEDDGTTLRCFRLTTDPVVKKSL